MKLKLATDRDSRWLYDLAMLPDVRLGSVRPDLFTYEQHCEWWARLTHGSGTRIYVAVEGRQRVGHVRFGRTGPKAEIAISVAPEHRRKGYALQMLLVGESLARKALGISTFVALVLTSNAASCALFEKAGYHLRGWEERMGKQCRRYEKDA